MLVVFAGRPGTGKTTLARLLATELKAAHLRLDTIEAAVLRSDLAPPPLGLVGYFVAVEVAVSCLWVGTSVVVDAVNPGAAARNGWTDVAESAGASLRVIELSLSDPVEHRRRVEERRSDRQGLLVPTWAQVQSREYELWDETRDGARLAVRNDGSPAEAMALVRAYLEAASDDDVIGGEGARLLGLK